MGTTVAAGGATSGRITPAQLAASLAVDGKPDISALMRPYGQH